MYRKPKTVILDQKYYTFQNFLKLKTRLWNAPTYEEMAAVLTSMSTILTTENFLKTVLLRVNSKITRQFLTAFVIFRYAEDVFLQSQDVVEEFTGTRSAHTSAVSYSRDLAANTNVHKAAGNLLGVLDMYIQLPANGNRLNHAFAEYLHYYDIYLKADLKNILDLLCARYLEIETAEKMYKECKVPTTMDFDQQRVKFINCFASFGITKDAALVLIADKRSTATPNLENLCNEGIKTDTVLQTLMSDLAQTPPQLDTLFSITADICNVLEIPIDLKPFQTADSVAAQENRENIIKLIVQIIREIQKRETNNSNAEKWLEWVNNNAQTLPLSSLIPPVIQIALVKVSAFQ